MCLSAKLTFIDLLYFDVPLVELPLLVSELEPLFFPLLFFPFRPFVVPDVSSVVPDEALPAVPLWPLVVAEPDEPERLLPLWPAPEPAPAPVDPD